MKTITKGEIFDLFYQRKEVSRSGGGKMKQKMCRLNVSIEKIQEFRKQVDDKKLLAYFDKLHTRKAGIAPPPRPKV